MKLLYPSKAKCLLVVIAIASLADTSFAVIINFQGLGHLSGGSYTEASDVSPDGSVVVGTSGSPPQSLQAFRWEDGVMTGLGTLPGGIVSEAWGVSNNGFVVVGNSVSASGQEAFRWEAVMSGLETLGGANSSATSVSADGSVVVGVSDNLSFPPMEAFRWEGDVMTGLDVLPGAIVSEAVDVSADGSVVAGNSGSDPAYMQAFRWEGDVMTELGYLLGGSSSRARAISADGLVVVGVGDYNDPDMEAFRWVGGVMTGLGYLPGGFGSHALDVSADGSVIVGEGYSASGRDAFIWDSVFGMRKVSDVLTGLGLDLTDWTLESCSGISDDGLTLVGNGINPSGEMGAWIATIPEPATVGLRALGAFGSCESAGHRCQGPDSSGTLD